MTENEALDIMNDLWYYIEHNYISHPIKEPDTLWSEEREEAYHMAEDALEEIEDYRKIGTVEECQKAMEKYKENIKEV